MKIAIVLSQGIHYFYYDRVVRLLHTCGHEIRIVCPAYFSEDGHKSGRALIKLLKEVDVTLEDALPRRSRAYFANQIRGLLNYSVFIRPEHPTPHLAEHWVGKQLSAKVLGLAQLPLFRAVLRSRIARKMLRFLEGLLHPEAQIIAWMREFQPQVVFASPFVFTSDVEVEYAKAAQALGIPVIAALLSWDNLTSKGTYQVSPDWLFLWNQALVDEAIQIHDIEPRRIFVSGAPVYDPWFDLSPATDRASFCARAGFNPAKPYVLYLCSSKSISDHESDLIKMLAHQLEQVEETKRPVLIVRPHPFKKMDEGELENDWVKVFPSGGQRPDNDEARAAYYDSLHHAAAVIGVNTTGFLESAILDKPCLTVITPLTSRGQEMRAHFKHLMNAGYIETAHDFPELVRQIMEILSGSDTRRENRTKFVRDFIRPHGVGVPAAAVTAGAILAVAQGRKPTAWRESLQA